MVRAKPRLGVGVRKLRCLDTLSEFVIGLVLMVNSS